MRVIFLNRFYWPSESATAQLLHDLATYLAHHGHDVTVITSDSAQTSRPATEIVDGVSIHRVSRHGAARGLVRKAREFVAYLKATTSALSRAVRCGDVVIAMTDPPMLGFAASRVARRKGAHLVHWTQDVYPEITLPLTGSSFVRSLARTLLPLRDSAWRRCAACVAISEEMAVHIRSRGVAANKVSVIPNWAPAGLAPRPRSAGAELRNDWGVDGKFVVAYSGNLGRVHDLDAIVALADAVRDDARIAIVIIGDGPGRSTLESAVASRSLRNVQFRPAQPRSALAESLAAADVHLITLRPGCAPFVFPSKFYGIGRVGRAIAFVGPRDCELAELIMRHRMGIAVTRDDLSQLAATLRRWSNGDGMAACEQAAADFGRNHGNAEQRLAQWQQLLSRFS